ncbi:hypothetical protein J2X09_003572 [Hydrogenophaga laconesensis]|uniref:Uncharacterized protein n=1 Tax=Hydrogenophaga laconesensis TaxID=1805971 RepID=A0ABU1VEQ5_9BURK|nr:hypothetical protein [Hydrogenophaga laconesensis]
MQLSGIVSLIFQSGWQFRAIEPVSR